LQHLRPREVRWMEGLGRLCLASRNIGDRGASLGSKGDKVGDIICVYWFQGVRVKDSLRSFNHFDTVLPLHNEIKHVDTMQSVLVSFILPDTASADTVEHRNQSSLWRSQHRLRPRFHRSFRCRTRPLPCRGTQSSIHSPS
jgi:hypothetical protein